FFQAEDGIRDRNVTGVQTCALPIFAQPILHGLCTYGVVAKAVTDRMLDADVTRVRSWAAQFAGTVLPGETLRTRAWRDGERILVTTTCLDRDEAPGLSNAVLATG